MSENNTLSLDISIDEINAMEPTALKTYAETQSALILERIQDAVAEIEDYQSSLDERTELNGFKSHFKNIMSKGDYKRDKDIDALYRSVAKMKTDSGSAMLKIVTLVQDSLKFTCATTKLSGQMTSAISVMMANGFKDSNGNLRQLDENTREFAEFILGQADMFVQNQQAYEQRMDSIDNLIRDIRDIEIDQDIRIDKALSTAEINKKNIQDISRNNQKRDAEIKKQWEVSEKIESEQNKAIQRQVDKDIEHDFEIARLSSESKTHDMLFAVKEEKDKSQDEEINRQAQKDLEHDEKLANYEEMINNYAYDIKKLKNDNIQCERSVDDLKHRIEELNMGWKEKIVQFDSSMDELKKEMISIINTKAEKTMNIVALVISLLAFLLAILQFF